jgi:hypothetical protein
MKIFGFVRGICLHCGYHLIYIIVGLVVVYQEDHHQMRELLPKKVQQIQPRHSYVLGFNAIRDQTVQERLLEKIQSIVLEIVRIEMHVGVTRIAMIKSIYI